MDRFDDEDGLMRQQMFAVQKTSISPDKHGDVWLD